jgi:hypothetical protein
VTRFEPSHYSDDELLGVVRDVCRYATPSRPGSVSQTIFDAARTGAGHPLAPTAGRICKRLHKSWDEVKAAALDPKRSHTKTATAWTRTEFDDAIGVDARVFALQMVTTRRGAESFTPNEYDEAAVELRADAKRRRHGGREAIPTSTQIITVFKNWRAVVRAAGLNAPRRKSDSVCGSRCRELLLKEVHGDASPKRLAPTGAGSHRRLLATAHHLHARPPTT